MLPTIFVLPIRLAIACYRRNALLTVAGGTLLGIILPALLLIAPLDQRTVMGINPWIKPIKFTVSLGAYFLTFGWLLGYLPGPRRAVRTISGVTAGAISLETPVLILQAVRGVPSHFNLGSSFDTALFYLMGLAAFTQMGMLAWALFLFCTQEVHTPRLHLASIRAGMALMLSATLPGLAMVYNNQHAVGVADGGAGLPFVNWSTAGGDLRIAHFLGLHAIQVLPLVGALLSWPNRMPKDGLGALVNVFVFRLFAAAYILLMIASFAQALSGLPLLSVR